MSESTELETEKLLLRAEAGDASAVDQLFRRNRERLKRMVSTRMDPRLMSRVDPSDVVQEAFTAANGRIRKFLDEKPIGFYPWLRQIAIEKLIDLHRHHAGASRRSVEREVRGCFRLPDDSAVELAKVAGEQGSPSQQLLQKELVQRVYQGLEQLPNVSREALLLRFVEQLTTKEAAEVSGISVSAFRGRQFRALAQLRSLLDEKSEGQRP